MADELPPLVKPRKDRFRRVAARRTQRILQDIQLLAKCANRSAYEYTADDVSKVFDAIENELRLARDRFQTGPKRKEVTFSFD